MPSAAPPASGFPQPMGAPTASAPPAAHPAAGNPAAGNPAGARPVQVANPFGRPAAAGPAARPQGIPGPGGVSIPPPPGFGPKPVAAAQPSAKPAAPQLAIKMEMGEEVVQAQRAARKKVFVLAGATAIVGLVIGFGVGQLVKGNEGAQAAVEGSELLVKEIDAANIVLDELEGTLTSAATKLQNGEYPSAEVEKLGAIDVPFDGSNLLNKGIGRYNQTALTMLVAYVNAVEDVESQKDKIRRLFGAAKEPFIAEAKEKDEPVVKWGVSIKGGPGGPWGQMSLIKPFEVVNKEKKANWPSEIEAGGKKAERVSKGDIEKVEGFLPIDPKSQGAVCPETLSLRLMGSLIDLRETLKGSDTPGSERDGVASLGTKVMDQLRKIGGG